jgi:hypothetical protein
MATIKLIGIDTTTGQYKFLESTDIALYVTQPSGGVAVRVLPNPGGASYTQVQLQALYDNQAGTNAPDTVPQLVTDASNLLNSSGYKMYLGHNQWFYQNVATGLTNAGWTAYAGGKGAFAANIVAIYTYK